jgi:hypothetical protein
MNLSPSECAAGQACIETTGRVHHLILMTSQFPMINAEPTTAIVLLRNNCISSLHTYVNLRVKMVAASMTAASARVAAKAGRSSASSAPRVAAFSAPMNKNLVRSANGKSFSASVAARVSSVKVCYLFASFRASSVANSSPRSLPLSCDVGVRNVCEFHVHCTLCY